MEKSPKVYQHKKINSGYERICYNPVGKIAENAVCRSVFFTIWHCILSAELTKPHSFRRFFGDFAHWESKSNNNRLIVYSFPISGRTRIRFKKTSSYDSTCQKTS